MNANNWHSNRLASAFWEHNWNVLKHEFYGTDDSRVLRAQSCLFLSRSNYLVAMFCK